MSPIGQNPFLASALVLCAATGVLAATEQVDFVPSPGALFAEPRSQHWQVYRARLVDKRRSASCFSGSPAPRRVRESPDGSGPARIALIPRPNRFLAGREAATKSEPEEQIFPVPPNQFLPSQKTRNRGRP